MPANRRAQSWGVCVWIRPLTIGYDYCGRARGRRKSARRVNSLLKRYLFDHRCLFALTVRCEITGEQSRQLQAWNKNVRWMYQLGPSKKASFKIRFKQSQKLMAVSILPCPFTPSLLRKVLFFLSVEPSKEGSTENRNLLSARAAHNVQTLRALLSAMEALPQAPWPGKAARFMANSGTPHLWAHVRPFFLKSL